MEPEVLEPVVQEPEVLEPVVQEPEVQEPVVQLVPDSAFEACTAAAMQNYCDIVRRRALPLLSSRFPTALGDHKGNLALTRYGAAALNEVNEDAYYYVRDASENINHMAYSGHVTDALRGQFVIVADGKLETGFPSKSEAFRVALDSSRRWIFNPQLPIVREVAAVVRRLEGRFQEFVPGAWVQLNTVPKWNKTAPSQLAPPEPIGKIDSIDSDSARVTWQSCAPQADQSTRLLHGTTTAVKFEFLTLLRPPPPYTAGDRVRVIRSLPAHMYTLERTVTDLTVFAVDDTVCDGTVLIYSPSKWNVHKRLNLMNDAWHFEIDTQ